MAYKRELYLEAKKLQGMIKAQTRKIEAATERGRLPRSALEYGFYARVDDKKRALKAGAIPRVPLSRMNIKQLKNSIRQMQNMTQLESFTITGIRKMRKEHKKSENAIMISAGLTAEQVKHMNARGRTNFFTLAAKIQETKQKPSDPAIKDAAKMINDTNMKPGELLRKWESFRGPNGTENFFNSIGWKESE